MLSGENKIIDAGANATCPVFAIFFCARRIEKFGNFYDECCWKVFEMDFK